MTTKLCNSLLPLQLREVSFTAASSPIITSASLNVVETGTTALLGHNGAGKSVLLKLLHGLAQPTKGDIRWGKNRLPTGKVRHRQAMVFQKPVLLRRSVAGNLQYVLNLPHTCSALNIHELLEIAELSALASQSARTLSGGEQQRLAFARALACGPDVLFLDEPTANLDPDATLRIERLIGLASQQGIKIFLVTHDLGQARRLAADVIFVRGGTIEEHSSASTFFSKPKSRYCQSFIDGDLGSENH